MRTPFARPGGRQTSPANGSLVSWQREGVALVLVATHRVTARGVASFLRAHGLDGRGTPPFARLPCEGRSPELDCCCQQHAILRNSLKKVGLLSSRQLARTGIQDRLFRGF